MSQQRPSTRAFIIFAFVYFLNSAFAWAMDLRVQDNTVYMSGPVVGHECADLKKILDTRWIRWVVLSNSNGGDANTGYCVGELIRARGVNTSINGNCVSSCSRMWLGGVERILDSPGSFVGLHGHYDASGNLLPDSPARLRAWIPRFASVDVSLMEKWIVLPRNVMVMRFYNDRAETCNGRSGCEPLPGKTARTAGLLPDKAAEAGTSKPASRHDLLKPNFPRSGFASVEDWKKLPIPESYLPNYFTYLNSASPKALAISLEKQTGAWNASKDPGVDLMETALRRCKERAGSDCVLYAVDDDVVFKP
jgi:hypothetical protein